MYVTPTIISIIIAVFILLYIVYVIIQEQPPQTGVLPVIGQLSKIKGQRLIRLDNAATTPPLEYVKKIVDEFIPYYGGIHRGTGFASRYSTQEYDKVRQQVLEFVSADPEIYTSIFTKNTTESLNLLANQMRKICPPDRDIVLTSIMEHHSNLLPWRNYFDTVMYVDVDEEGRFDMLDYAQKMDMFGERVAVVTVTGCSNVTGILPPIEEIGEIAHKYGAWFVVDGAQLVPHRQVHVGNTIDAIAFSAHKMYAPYGIGVLVVRKDWLDQATPYMQGGGEVEFVTCHDVIWSKSPARDEAGSPNVVGVVALGAAIDALQNVGMDALAEHESLLLSTLFQELLSIPNVRVLGPHNIKDRVGVVTFHVKDRDSFTVSNRLDIQFNISVRAGCYCAHPYVMRMIHAPTECLKDMITKGRKDQLPTFIRVSLGLFNTMEDVRAFIHALHIICNSPEEDLYFRD